MDCLRKKSVSEFYVKEKRTHATRYFSRCKKCYSLFVHREKGRASGIDTVRRLTDAQRLDRKKAWAAVNNDVYKGRLVKPRVCSRCGLRGNIHGHHHDGYLRRRAVQWLCEPCHRKRHAV